MALLECEECGREISQKAKSCPHCGVPVKIKGTGEFRKIILGVVIFALLFVVMLYMRDRPTSNLETLAGSCEQLKTRVYDASSSDRSSRGGLTIVEIFETREVRRTRNMLVCEGLARWSDRSQTQLTYQFTSMDNNRNITQYLVEYEWKIAD
jgi:hypothetical protein